LKLTEVLGSWRVQFGGAANRLLAPHKRKLHQFGPHHAGICSRPKSVVSGLTCPLKHSEMVQRLGPSSSKSLIRHAVYGELRIFV